MIFEQGRLQDVPASQNPCDPVPVQVPGVAVAQALARVLYVEDDALSALLMVEALRIDPGLEVTYRPRGTRRALARQYFDYGRWKRVVLRRHPGSLRWRQAIPPAATAAVAASALVGIYRPRALAVPLAYAAAVVAAAGRIVASVAGAVSVGVALGRVGLGRAVVVGVADLVLVRVSAALGAGYVARARVAHRAVVVVVRTARRQRAQHQHPEPSPPTS